MGCKKNAVISGHFVLPATPMGSACTSLVQKFQTTTYLHIEKTLLSLNQILLKSVLVVRRGQQRGCLQVNNGTILVKPKIHFRKFSQTLVVLWCI